VKRLNLIPAFKALWFMNPIHFLAFYYSGLSFILMRFAMANAGAMRGIAVPESGVAMA